MSTQTRVEVEPIVADQQPRRKRMVLAFSAALAVAALGCCAYWLTVARFVESTDDAYVGGNVIQLAPQTPGTVVSIRADDTDFVKAGTVMVQLDQTDARLAVEQATAQLAQVIRRTRTLYQSQSAQAANVAGREADLAKARSDLAHRRALAGSGAVSDEEIRHAQDGVNVASAALDAAREQWSSSRTLAGASPLDEHPEVAQAVARVKEAQLALERTAVVAPENGFVARRVVQVGQRVAVGTPLLSVVPLDQLWVDANFKESQLRHMRIGQSVTLTSDLFGKSVVYHGTVAGLGAGTGSAFSLLPPQNATGNWIKVVQRLPVRVKLDPDEVRAHPLRVGLSVVADVDIKDRSGTQLATAEPDRPVAQTAVYDAQAQAVDTAVERLVAADTRH
ncbi:HlyD family efflux transporter periplasmic adaptor subunit [Burkholderia anthina]|uniref:HlyD family secretion protein n=1 Tax=Burkholderia anthina TaxID=179879 RepID=UPI00158BA2DF